ncbi:MAG: hypothetical protein Q7R61_00805 [bacterium]|nr:hypothetical protein [bacterium]
MRYKIVAVDPLKKPFPLLSFDLANVASVDDARGQIRTRGVKAQAAEIETLAEIATLEERWAEGKIEPALKLHLARQERRLEHFKSACRFFGCDNPHPLGSAYFRRFGHGAAHGSSMPKSTVQAAMQGTKRHSPQFFCGGHRWLKSQLSNENYARLSDPKYRVKVA